MDNLIANLLNRGPGIYRFTLADLIKTKQVEATVNGFPVPEELLNIAMTGDYYMVFEVIDYGCDTFGIKTTIQNGEFVCPSDIRRDDKGVHLGFDTDIGLAYMAPTPNEPTQKTKKRKFNKHA